MKNKYKATPKTYASQARRNGKVTAQLVGLLSRADVHVEEKELKSISTEEQERLARIYHSGGVVGHPRWMNVENQFSPYEHRDVEVIQGRNRFPQIGRLNQIYRFDPPVNVRAGEDVFLGAGRVFIGNTNDPDNMREIGVARDVRVDPAPARDRMALVQMDFAGAEARVVHNYSIQSAIAEEMGRAMSRRMDAEILNGVGASMAAAAEAFGSMSEAAQSATLTLDSLSEAYARVSESVFGARMFGRRYLAEKQKKKKKVPNHPDTGKVVARRKTRRTLLGTVVTDVRDKRGAIKRTSQLGYIVENQRRGKNGRK